jgi:Holliday junction resolvasome RuvABC endonuclease subunit
MRDEEHLFAEKAALCAIGIDPGFASFGYCVLDWVGSERYVAIRDLGVVETKKSTKKEMQQTRVSVDDQRRLKEIWDTLCSVSRATTIQAVGLESYSPNPVQKGGSAWKVSLAYQLAVAWAWSQGLSPVVYVPIDLKIAYSGKRSATKEEIGEMVLKKVPGLALWLPKKRSIHEHIYDAAGYAYMSLIALAKLRKDAGVT